MKLLRLAFFLISLPLILGGCGDAQQSTSRQSSINYSYKKPTFEPMSLEQYKAAHPNLLGLDCGMEKFFDTYINVYGVTIAAMPKTPIPETIHAAKIYAQLIDNDEDFIPDDPNGQNCHLIERCFFNALSTHTNTEFLFRKDKEENKRTLFTQVINYWRKKAQRQHRVNVKKDLIAIHTIRRQLRG